MHYPLHVLFPLLFFVISLSLFTIINAKITNNNNNNIHTIILKPDIPVNNVQMPSYDGEAKIVFTNLVPNTKYDIKISYPGTTPTQFIFLKPEELVQHSQGNNNVRLRRRRRRRLLDTEKYGIVTTKQTSNMDPIYLHTEKYGVSYDENIEKRPIRFNIVLETVVLGIIPKETFSLIVFIIIVLFLTYKYYVPFLKNILTKAAMNEVKRDA